MVQIRDISLYVHTPLYEPLKVPAISDYDSESSLRHVHCPKCGKMITREMLQGSVNLIWDGNTC